MSKRSRAPTADPHVVRRKNLKILAAQWGSMANLAKQLGISPGYASQLGSGYRPFTEKTARKCEERLGIPAGWLDEERRAPATPALVDHGLMARSQVLIETLLEEAGVKVSQAKFSELVVMAYEEALLKGRPDEAYLRRLINLAR